jgi:NADPH2:quinone reductase
MPQRDTKPAQEVWVALCMMGARLLRPMIAIEIREPGEPDVLVPADRPRPAPAGGEVLIKVAAAGVNRPDIMQRLGKYPPPPGASDIPGLEVAGVVEQIGDGVHGWRAGDRVCALVAGGGYAEYCVAPAPQCLPVPSRLDLTAAAAIPETFFTVWTNVFERGRLVAGESLLVHGGASGIGTTAIQLARAFGARVFATAGSAEKCAACERLGAERAVNYRSEDFAAVVRDATGGRGVDVILDMVGGDYVARNVAALALDGRLVQIATLGGSRVPLDLRAVMQRRLTLTGSTLRARSVAEKGAIAQALRERVWPLLEVGVVAPVVHATFPLRAAADAHRLMEADTHIGKIVLVV